MDFPGGPFAKEKYQKSRQDDRIGMISLLAAKRQSEIPQILLSGRNMPLFQITNAVTQKACVLAPSP